MPEAGAKKTTKRTTKKRVTKKSTTRKRTPAKKKASAKGTLRVKQIRSEIGHAEKYRRTLRALGLRHHQHEVFVMDNPSVHGMLHHVRNLVRVTREEA